MTSRRRNLLVILLVLGMLAASVVVIATKPTRLGLDLRGGVELVYEAQPTAGSEVTPEAVDRSIDVIRDRVDQLGVAEPEIQRLGQDQIAIGLPGVKDLDRAKRVIGSTAQLYMYDFAEVVVPRKAEPGANSTTLEQTRPFTGPNALYDAVKAASKRKPTSDGNNTTPCATPKQPQRCGQYYLFGRNKKLLAGPDVSRADLLSQFDGKKPRGSQVLVVPYGTIVVQSEQPSSASNDTTATGYYIFKDNPSIKGTQISDPRAEPTGTASRPGPAVTFQFKNGGSEQFKKTTGDIAQRALLDQLPGQPAVPQTFAVVLDRKIESRASVDPQEYPNGIDGRTGAEISGLDSAQEANDLADVLKTGALPVTLKPISQVQVSATLGQQALDQGLLAGIVGLIVVAIFLLAFYRLLGLLAVAALGVYGVLFFALIKLIPITLTLPGIAGLILTIGVAADSNIVIFERIKEELRAGRSTAAALATGYSRGIRTIIDANVVTLITAFILFVLATAGVKGFAFTLMIGTVVSFLTAVVFTQAVLGSLGNSRLLHSKAALGAGREARRWRPDFMGVSRWLFATSGVILVIGSVALSTKGLNFGIDFESGTRVTVALEKSASVADVRDALAPIGLGKAKIQEISNSDLGDNVVQISTEQLGPNDVQKLEKTLEDDFGVPQGGISSESIGPTFGATVARSAIYAIIFSLLSIMGYIALRFEAKFAIPVLIAVLHDILITGGVYALVGREVTTSTVAALLTILGYSLYDTVIVFDRVRENAPRMPRATFSQIVNRSLSEVLTRSLATTFSTCLPVIALLLFGGETLQDFAFALLVGIISGSYSSIFIATPVLMHWKEREPSFRQRRRRMLDEYGYVPAYVDAPTTPEATADNGAMAGEEMDGSPERSLMAAEPQQEEAVEFAEATDDGERVEAPKVVETPDSRVAEPAPERPARPPKSQRKKQRKRQHRRKHGRRR